MSLLCYIHIKPSNFAINNKNSKIMEQQLSKAEMSTIRGGRWVYDSTTNKWYWIAGLDLN